MSISSVETVSRVDVQQRTDDHLKMLYSSVPVQQTAKPKVISENNLSYVYNIDNMPTDVLERANRIKVVKRNGQTIKFDIRKVYIRCESARNPVKSTVLNMRKASSLSHIDVDNLVIGIVQGISIKIKSVDIDDFIATTCMWKTHEHPNYNILGGRIKISSMQKRIPDSLTEMVKSSAMGSSLSRKKIQILMPWYVEVIQRYEKEFMAMIDFSRDYETGRCNRRNSFSLMAYQGLEKAFIKIDGQTIERPQHLFIRVAIGIMRRQFEELKQNNWDSKMASDIFAQIKETYDATSFLEYTHASPTLYNAGTKQGLTSCFLFSSEDDLVKKKGIYDTLRKTAAASKGAGGLATAIHELRSKGTLIAGTGGICNGIMPVLKIFDDSSEYVDQGGNKRPGSNAVYNSMIHPESREFISVRSNADKTDETKTRLRCLFPALWIEDVTMKAILCGKKIHQLDPSEYPGLSRVHGEKFERMYESYIVEAKERVKDAKARSHLIPNGTTANMFVGYKTERSTDMISETLEMFQGSGLPYCVFKDHVNHRDNMINLDDPNDIPVLSSNLCTEIMQKPDSCCNLASQDVSTFVDEVRMVYDYNRLYRNTRLMVRNLNNVIDASYYAVKETQVTNELYRPMGVGIQGLAYAFAKLKIGYDSPEACEVNKKIHETMYFAALEESCQLAQEQGTYPKYEGCPASKGLLQQDLFENHWNYMTKYIQVIPDMIDHRIKKLNIKFMYIEEASKCVSVMQNWFTVKNNFLSEDDSKTKMTPSERIINLGNQLVAKLRSMSANQAADMFEKSILPMLNGKAPQDQNQIPGSYDAKVVYFDTKETENDYDKADEKVIVLLLESLLMASSDKKQEIEEDLLDIVRNKAALEVMIERRNMHGCPNKPSGLWDWAPLRKRIQTYGLRNCLLIALMPTASTSVVLERPDSFGKSCLRKAILMFLKNLLDP